MDSSKLPEQVPPTADAMPISEPFTMGSRTTLIAVSLVMAILIAFIFSFTRRRPSSKRTSVLILGPIDSGKTAVHSTLAFGRALPTHTSIQANSTLYTTAHGRTLRLVDIPGHPRLRDQFTDHLEDTAAVVFVVDSASIARNGAVVAEHLHSVLRAISTLPASQTAPSLLIHAHKSDLVQKQQAISRVTAVLERELEKRRAAQAGGVGVEGLGETEGGEGESGLECTGGTFKFSQWEGGEVSFGEGWVKVVHDGVEKVEDEKEGATEDGLESLREWLEEL
ncbi:signal recognition particle receptor subunit beta [Rhizoctonia solani 123E]|uniref:Signal recognition particle receptor subunit beta n=1 Tax=Rhizoctonia solani 123E TaxID=1423351 RepID=A0A074SAG0_9AGAM|nr:signal recognition particle receptor subunit beta [Rhizoctonia solani 123E]